MIKKHTVNPANTQEILELVSAVYSFKISVVSRSSTYSPTDFVFKKDGQWESFLRFRLKEWAAIYKMDEYEFILEI